jgi:hypothetical protein
MAARKKAPAKKAKARKARVKKAAKRKPRIPGALRKEVARMKKSGRIPRRLVDSLSSDMLDELFPDVDESDIYD